MAHYSEAKGSGHRGKRLHHLEVSKGEKGYSVEHHFAQDGAMTHYQQPEVHNFGDGEGHEMLAHVGKAMGVDVPGEPEEPEEEGEQAAEGKYYTESKARKG